MEPWQTVLLSLGGNTAAVAVLAWLGKTLVEKVLARDAKRYELELQAASTAAIERLKSDLQIRAIEHQVRFSRLHDKSAETIAEIHEKLTVYIVAVAQYVKLIEWRGDKPKSERLVDANNALKDFHKHFLSKRIFLPKETAKRIDEISGKLLHAAQEFAFATRGQTEYPDNETWMKSFKTVNEEIPPILEQLEDDFRQILGRQSVEAQSTSPQLK